MGKITGWFSRVWRKLRYGGVDLADKAGDTRAQSHGRIPPNQRMSHL